MSTAWSWYVIVIVASNIIGCVWLLWWTGKRSPGDPAPTQTSHVWDGDITEYNQPMPRWWIVMFYVTIVFSVAYLAYYPGMGNYPGAGNWTSAREHAADKSVQDAKVEASLSRFAGKDVGVLAGDAQAIKLGRSIFGNTCATCHGSSGRGALGYPDLGDDVWHWGGAPEQVLQTILDGRDGVMPAWGTVLTGMGGEHAQDYVIAYVRSLGRPAEATSGDYMASRGKSLYEGVCAACHGPKGKGTVALGAPDLTDTYWLYGSDNQSMHKTLAEGRHGVMPAHRQLLGETRARLVAAYVLSLSRANTKTSAAGVSSAAQ